MKDGAWKCYRMNPGDVGSDVGLYVVQASRAKRIVVFHDALVAHGNRDGAELAVAVFGNG
jgi:hypothetical protein